MTVPLSEREQKILDEIESHLHQEDPKLARGGHRRPALSARLGAVLFLAGFAALIAFFVVQNVLLGVLAFGTMVAGIVLIAGSMRDSFVVGESPAERVSRAFGRWEERLRQRNRRL